MKPVRFARAVARHIRSGRKKVSDEAYEARLAVCRPCRFRRPGKWQCSKCGCGLKMKAAWQSERCPVGLWEEIKQMKQAPKLTIGMACFDDFEGVWYSVQALRIYHQDIMHLCEIVVIDNNPTSKDGKACKVFIEGACKGVGRYVEFPEPKGSCPPRGHLFEVARGEWVLCIDSHVLLPPGSLARLLAWIKDNPESSDLIHGPMVSNSLNGTAEAMMRPQWRSEMFGTWARDERTQDPNGPPFEIPMHGLGCFAMRRAAWPGFNPGLVGFSGGEGYIHEKVRQRGGQVLCHPGLRWVHKFQRPGGVPHRPQREQKIRNVLLGWSELGMDIQAIVDHFCGGLGMRGNRPAISEAKMQKIIDDAGIDHQVKIKARPPESNGHAGLVVGPTSFGGFGMRGKPIVAASGWPVKNSRGKVELKNDFAVGLAVKCAPPPVMRQKCKRLILDVMDLWWDNRQHMRMDPKAYWQMIHGRHEFDELIATSPAVADSMRAALPGVTVHMVPHAADPRVQPGWRDPGGPIVYAGGRVFVEKYRAAITEAGKRIGRQVVFDHAHHAWRSLQGASLVLAIRLPPYATPLNQIGKPQVKIANAAAAGIPVLCTDRPAVVSLWPGLADVCAPVEDFTSVPKIAAWLEKALAHKPPKRQFTHAAWLEKMQQVLA